MNLLLFVIVITCLNGSLSRSFEDIREEIVQKINSVIDEGRNKITDIVNDIDTGATLLRDSVQDYVEYQEKQLTDDFYQYVDSIQEKQRMIGAEFNNYIETLKETGRKATETFTVIDETNDTVNPDLSLTAPEMIERQGFTCETHTVISQGYVLNIHRIPRSNNGSEISGKTVFLQHGLFGSTVDWILNGPGKGLAYVLADAGYDVWMSNIRGNRYSREHKYYSPESEEYWNFSWHDVALNDIPNIIDYITELKGVGTEIVYMGHSMGTTILFAMLTVRPEYNSILTAGYALAPVVFFTNFKSPIKSLTPIASNVAYIEKLYGLYEFVPKNSALGKLTSSCRPDTQNSFVCRNFMFYICGYNEEQFNETLLPVFLTHLGTGTPWKTVVHFSQLITSGKFRQFDHGSVKNVFQYGSLHPPEYDLTKITLPISLFWSENDLLSSEEDVMLLKSKIKTNIKMYKVPDPKFNHLDYIWAINVKELLNDKVLECINEEFRH